MHAKLKKKIFKQKTKKFFLNNSKNKSIRCADTFLFRFLGNFFKEYKNKKILDIGYGNCENINEFIRRGAECFGISLIDNTTLLEKNKKIFKNNFLHYDFNQFKKFRFKKKFDLIICLDTIYYVADLDNFFKEIKKCLKKNGLFVFQYIESQEIINYDLKNYKNIKKLTKIKKIKSTSYLNYKKNPIRFLDYEKNFHQYVKDNNFKFKFFLSNDNQYIRNNKKSFIHKNIYIVISN
tara:strand:+ start:1205 stop:1912 length:708 start_codon:yes stop_codon:yes gene_type:complete